MADFDIRRNIYETQPIQDNKKGNGDGILVQTSVEVVAATSGRRSVFTCQRPYLCCEESTAVVVLLPNSICNLEVLQYLKSQTSKTAGPAT